jgi:hypothetical protein
MAQQVPTLYDPAKEGLFADITMFSHDKIESLARNKVCRLRSAVCTRPGPAR